MNESVSDVVRLCDACGGSCVGEQIRVRSVVDNSVGTFGACTSCGSLRVLDEIDYGKLYESRDSSNYPRAGMLVALKQFYLRSEAHSLVSSVKLGASAKVLDYGCGGGEFSNAMYSAGMHSVSACDMQDERPESLRTEISYFRIADIAEVDSNVFDLIIMRHVLEHIENPVVVIERLASYLSPNGRLVIEVPSSHSLFRVLHGGRWSGYFYPFHINIFSEFGLRILAKRCGLTVNSVEPCNTPIFGVYLMGFGIVRPIARVLSMFLYPLQCLLNRLTGRYEAIKVVLQK